MLFPIDDNIFKNGFCWGRFEARVDEASRLRLNKGIITILKENKVRQLWRFLDPLRKGLILCPPQNRQRYIEIAITHFPPKEDNEVSYRKYISTGEPTAFDKQGRISFTAACIEYSKIKPGDQIILLGIGPWYELWSFEEWLARIHNQSGGSKK